MDMDGYFGVPQESLHPQLCRVCLSNEQKLYLMGDAVSEQFSELTGQMLNEVELPRSLCAQCVQLLSKCVKFKMKAQRAYEILMTYNVRDISSQQFQNHHPQFQQQLSTKIIPPGHYDLFVEHTATDTEPKLFENKVESPLSLELNVAYDEDKADITKKINGDIGIVNIKDEPEIDVKYFDEDFNDSDADSSDSEFLIALTKNTMSKEKTSPKKKSVINNKSLTKKKSKITSKRHLKIKDKNVYKTSKVRDSNDNREFEKYFTTRLLSMKQQVEEHSAKSEKDSYLKAPFKCEFCFEGFLRTVTFETHMAKHNDANSFKCAICALTYENRRRLKNHSRLHSDLFLCKMCPFKTKARSAAQLHIKWHKGVKYQCDKCGSEFERVSTLLSHVRIKHPTDQVCALCGYAFICERGLRAHHKLIHRHDPTEVPEDGPSCEQCNIKFASQPALDTHYLVSGKHGNPLRNELRGKAQRELKRKKGKKPVCEKLFDTPVPCEQCGLPQRSRMEYHAHFSRQHRAARRAWYPPDQYTQLCDLCGKILKFGTMKAHMVEHEHNGQLACPHPACGKVFRNLACLKQHADSHNEERFECPLCPKKFNRQNNLTRHKKYVHTDVKKFKCDFCEKHFKEESARKLHVKHVHLRAPWPKRSRAPAPAAAALVAGKAGGGAGGDVHAPAVSTSERLY